MCVPFGIFIHSFLVVDNDDKCATTSFGFVQLFMIAHIRFAKGQNNFSSLNFAVLPFVVSTFDIFLRPLCVVYILLRVWTLLGMLFLLFFSYACVCLCVPNDPNSRWKTNCNSNFFGSIFFCTTLTIAKILCALKKLKLKSINFTWWFHHFSYICFLARLFILNANQPIFICQQKVYSYSRDDFGMCLCVHSHSKNRLNILQFSRIDLKIDGSKCIFFTSFLSVFFIILQRAK